jgi:hypothetical protein
MSYAYSPIMHGLGSVPIKPTGVEQSDHAFEETFENEIRLLVDTTESSTSGAGMVWGGQVRRLFDQKSDAFAIELRTRALQGSITWREAFTIARTVRDEVITTLMLAGTSLGRKISEALEKEGETFNELIGKKTVELFGKNKRFDLLSAEQKDRVFAEIVEFATKSGSKVNQTFAQLPKAGRPLAVIAVAIAIYHIATMDESVKAAEKAYKTASRASKGKDSKNEGSSAKNDAADDAANEIAGIKCGAGVPACVGIGQFVGGTVSRFGSTDFW